MSLGWQELIVIFLILLLLFGPRMPEIGRSLGKGIKSFKEGLMGIEETPSATPESKKEASAEKESQEASAESASAAPAPTTGGPGDTSNEKTV